MLELHGRVSYGCLLFCCLLGSGCAQFTGFTDYRHLEQRRARLALSEQENGRKVDAIAQEVQRAYVDVDFLSFNARPVWHGTVQARIEVAMSPGKLKTRLYVDKTLAYVLTVHDGILEESKRALRSVPAAHEVRKTNRPGGTDDLHQMAGIEEYGCMMGGVCASWLGPSSHKVQYLVERIRRGEYLGTRTLRRQQCRLVLCQPTEEYGGIELFYVRPDGLVMQHDTFLSADDGGTPTFIRTRPYADFSTAPLPEKTWTFEQPARVKAWRRLAANRTDRSLTPVDGGSE